ncbi:hypothetical protein GR925_28430 [Streptomyces sp. HUCO-GS316]|uniref:hypothetical protein n=1 Tax=Streptomyces sp. HUCO-GS316 TaxID=2692198 RepID=UPI00136C8849|nr:hypothetical protein [Streptomyces sp. HUCO-GS316]MXM67252.1 hypothetical protein [Streptomyces sp. HUCO-GS316]
MHRWRDRVRELAVLTGALAGTLVLMLWGASSASAGGPTSVLVTSPSNGKASALYVSDRRYGELWNLLGEAGGGTPGKPPEADLAHARQINVTWMAHDISPWRMDQVYVVESRPHAVWIHTAAEAPENMNGYWHRAMHPAQLRALFKSLGMTGKVSGDGDTGIVPAPRQPDSAETAGHGTDWWWALPGAAAGAAALVLRPLAIRVPVGDRWGRMREPGPRQELRDV